MISSAGLSKNLEVVTIVDSRNESILRYLSPLALIRSIVGNRQLIWQLAWREVNARYRGTQLGLAWSFLNPLLLLVVYTYVFSSVLHAKWTSDPNDPPSFFSFAIILFAGMTAFNIFTEVIARAPSLIVSCPNYVKRVVFPLEAQVMVALSSALVTFCAGFAILMICQILQGPMQTLFGVENKEYHQILGWAVVRVGDGNLVHHVVGWTILLVPVAILPLILLAMGFGWLLASLGVFLRDIGQSVGLIVQILSFITPIFYPVEAIPLPLQPIMIYNPLTAAVDSFRRVVIWGKLPHWPTLITSIVAGLVCCQLGYAFFMRTKKAFADVI